MNQQQINNYLAEEINELKRKTNPYDLDWHNAPAQLVELEGSSKIIVETPDEFLASFDIQDFNKPQIIQWMKTMEIAANQIGERSASGRLYNVPNKNYVLKIVNVCPQPNVNLNIIQRSMCTFAQNGDIVYRIPNTTTGKMTVLAPDYVIEGVMGILLSRLNKNTPSFCPIYGFQYDPQPPEKPLYILMEKLQSARNFFRSVKELYFGMFQVAQALAVGQQLCRYNHYDLHSGNIMTRGLGQRRTRIYELGDGKYLYTRFDFDTVIIDYGFNRMETENNVIVGKMFMNAGRHNDILDHREFNPYVDLVSNLFTNLKFNPYPIPVNDKNNAVLEMLRIALNMDDSSDNDVIEVINNHLLTVDNWRPDPDRLAMPYYRNGQLIFSHCCTPQQFMVKLAKKISEYVPPVPANIDGPDLGIHLAGHYFAVLDRIIKPNSTSKVYALPDARKRMDTSFLNYKLVPSFQGEIFQVRHFGPADIQGNQNIRQHYMPFNITRFPGQDARNIYGHVATINVRQGKRFGFKFNFECCRIDPRVYMQQSNKNGCIAVNASFFKILENFTPIGYFRSPDYISQTPFPPDYRQFYGLVCINSKGELLIDRNLDNYSLYDSVITCGPLLVYNNQILLDDQTIQNNPILQNQGVDIAPGELSHVGNPNPRTAIGTNANNDVIIVTIEGRSRRGAGVDCSQLAQICREAGMVNAINLDGGRSSQLVWREPGSNEISLASHSEGYPVGNIISYCK